MSQILIDRILETCIRNDCSDVYLIDQCTPVLRSERGVRSFLTSPLKNAEVASIAAQIVPVQKGRSRYGFREGELTFGTYKFMAAVVGEPNPLAIVLMRGIDNALDATSVVEPGTQSVSAISWQLILHEAVREGVRDTLIVSNAPPILRSIWGLHSLVIPPITESDFTRLAAEISAPPDVAGKGVGYQYYRTTFLNVECTVTIFQADVSPQPNAILISRVEGAMSLEN